MGETRNFKDDLAEQWDFLQSSMIAFDEGRWHEAKRLAVTIRVMVYDYGGKSLLTQMGVKDKLQWMASGGGVNPRNMLPTTSLTSMSLTTLPNGAEAAFVPHDAEYVLDPTSSRLTTFDDWWTTLVIKDAQGRTFSRKNLVLMLANRDGGAHVGRLDPKEAALASGRSFGWAITIGDETLPIELSPVFPSVRSIATELHLVLLNQRQLLGLDL